MKSLYQEDTCVPMIITALVTKARKWNKTKCSSSNECIKMLHIYTMKYYSFIKGEQTPVICFSVDENG
jgi:hypothetical protein